tara:strand:+ start:226 stop:465 length:240 start_codon:yes stop_codon:yes gene_type:complete
MRVAINQARSESEIIKNKNLIEVFVKPMIYYLLNASKKSFLFDDIHVSTVAKEIKKTLFKGTENFLEGYTIKPVFRKFS